MYVIDGRIDDSHHEFDAVEVLFMDSIVPSFCTSPPEYRHPTAVASPVNGVAKKPTVVSVQAGTWEDRKCASATVIREALKKILADIVDKGRQKTSVVNLAWSQPDLNACEALRWYLQRFWLTGITVVNSAGNQNDDVQY